MKPEAASIDSTEPASVERAGALIRFQRRIPSIGFYQTIFLIYIVTAMLLFTFFVPPFQKSDELAHFYRSVSLTNFDLICTKDENGDGYFVMKQKYSTVAQTFHVWEVALNYNNKYNRDWPGVDFSDPSFDEPGRVYDTCTYPPPGYLPVTAGVWLGKPFENPVVSLYAGRVAGALFFLVALAFALKLTPEPYKLPLYFYGGLPAVLHQVTTVGYDAANFSAIALVFAFFTRFLVAESRIKPWELVAFLGLLTWQLSIREAAFLPLLLLFFVLKPSHVNPDRSRYLMISGAFVAVVAIVTIVLSVAYNPISETATEPVLYSGKEQMRLILENPWRFIHASYSTLHVEGQGLTHQGISGFGWQDYGFDFFTYYIFLFAAACVLIITVLRDRLRLSGLQSLILVAALGGTVASVMGAAYIAWTPVGADYIWGLQGRYFLVLLPFAMVAGAQAWALLGRERVFQILLVVGVLIVIRNIYRAIDLRYFG